MDGSTIPYYVVEERKKLNRCIEEAPNDYEKEIYRLKILVFVVRNQYDTEQK